MAFLFPEKFEQSNNARIIIRNPGWYITCQVRPDEETRSFFGMKLHEVLNVAFEPGEEVGWCFPNQIDCEIACRSFIQAGYDTYEKMEDLADNHPNEFKRIACENLRW